MKLKVLTFVLSLYSALALQAANYYVDYSAGADTNAGTSTATAWKHCPGDPAATGTALAKTLAAGDTVFFKGGVSYVFTGANGISLKWNGTSGSPITYDGNSAGTWGTGRAKFTDNYSAKGITAFQPVSSGGGNLTFRNLEIGPIGGSATLPTDTGSAIAPKPGYGIVFSGRASNILIDSCYFHDLGYWFNAKPMGANSIDGCGVSSVDPLGITVSKCDFRRVSNATGFYSTATGLNGVTVSDCTFSDSIRWCIDLAVRSSGASMDNITVKGCTFFDYNQFDQSFWTGYGDWPHTDGIFFRADYPGGTWGNNIFFYNNLFYSSIPGAGGTASIYITEGPSAAVYNNLFVHQGKTRAISLAGGPMSGASAQKLYILNNTFLCNYVNQIDWGNSISPVASGPGSFLKVQNNIFYDSQTKSGNNFLAYSSSRDPAASFTWDYNLYRSMNQASWHPIINWAVIGEANLAALQGYGWETHGKTADPLFTFLDATETQPLLNNLRLQPTSPARGAGVNLTALGFPGLTKDRDGNNRPSSGAWDLGAHQYFVAVAPSNAVVLISLVP